MATLKIHKGGPDFTIRVTNWRKISGKFPKLSIGS